MGDAKNNTCCCGPFRTRIETGTYVIALLGFVLGTTMALVSAFHLHEASSTVGHVLSALLYLSVMIAQKKNNPSLFLPFLIIGGIVLVLGVIFFIVLIVLATAAILSATPHVETKDDLKALMVGTAAIITAVSMAIALALHTWFYSIIYRTYKSMKETLALGSVPPPV